MNSSSLPSPPSFSSSGRFPSSFPLHPLSATPPSHSSIAAGATFTSVLFTIISALFLLSFLLFHIYVTFNLFLVIVEVFFFNFFFLFFFRSFTLLGGLSQCPREAVHVDELGEQNGHGRCERRFEGC
jgi:hypothetical protein